MLDFSRKRFMNPTKEQQEAEKKGYKTIAFAMRELNSYETQALEKAL